MDFKKFFQIASREGVVNKVNGRKMKNVSLAIFLLTVSTTVNAGNMELFDCEGKETGKIKGWISKEQLLIECFENFRVPSICEEHPFEPICLCSIRFGVHKFRGTKDK